MFQIYLRFVDHMVGLQLNAKFHIQFRGKGVHG